MFQNTYIKNLAIPETTIGFVLNLVFKYFNLVFVPNPKDYFLSCNLILLKKYDKCDETRGKISFIPLEYLTSVIENDKKQFNSKIEKKKYYLKKLIHEHNVNASFFSNNKFKNVPLEYFRKSYLSSDLTKTIDHCRITYYTEEENIANNKINLQLINPLTDITRNKNEWLSKYDIVNVIKPYLYVLDDEKRNIVSFKDMLFINNKTYLTRQFFYSQIKTSFTWNIEKGSRFVCFFILYRSHFTAVFIDLDVTTKNDHKTKFAYFFNSCGYDPNNFQLDKNYWFINSDMSFMRHKNCFVEYVSNNYINTPIEALTDILKTEYNVTNFVFNTFSIQNLDSECGMFSTMFLLTCINMLDKKSLDNITVNVMRFVYYNMLSLGSDHIYSCFRGLFFFTNEDAEKHSISKPEYQDSPYVFKIKNTKYNNYCKIYRNSLKKIMDMTKLYEEDMLNIEEIINE